MGAELRRTLDRLTGFGKRRLLSAAAHKFRDITLSNFGMFGKDRPTPWDALSKRYARRVGRSYATMELTGELKRSITVRADNSEYAEVFTDDVPYAAAHQFGKHPQPLRPYFPVTEAEKLTPYAENEIKRAIEAELLQMGLGR